MGIIEEYLAKSYYRMSDRTKQKLESGLGIPPTISIEELLTDTDPLLRVIGKQKCIDQTVLRHEYKKE